MSEQVNEVVVSFDAKDGKSLVGTLFSPEDIPVTRSALISAGTAFPQRIYAKFARWLAARGCLVMTFDYRGVGGSAPECLADPALKYQDWGRYDLTAAADFLAAQAPGQRMDHIAHSVGGHFVGFMENHDLFQRHAFLAVGSGYWGHHKLWFMPAAWMLWHVVGNWSVSRLGFVKPGNMWRGEPLPGGVWRDWKRWSHKVEYMTDELAKGELGKQFFGQVTAPIKWWVFDDDPIATPRASHTIQRLYKSAEITEMSQTPKDYGLKAIGHDGMFRTKALPIWEEVWDWLE